MDKEEKLNESGCSPSLKTYHFEPNIYTKYLSSCGETIHSFGNGITNNRKRIPFDYDEVNQTKLPKRVRMLNEEVVSSALKNAEIFRAGYLYPAVLDAKCHALSYSGTRFGFSSPSKAFYDRSLESDLPFPEQYTPDVHCGVPTAFEDFGLKRTKYGGLYKEFTPKSKTEISVGERERNLKRAIDSEDPNHRDEPEGRNNKDWAQEYNDTSKKADERTGYWERRRRNNASAKKSRDARRAREMQTQVKVNFLEKENMRMLAELLAIRHENLCLRRVLGSKM